MMHLDIKKLEEIFFSIEEILKSNILINMMTLHKVDKDT